MSAEELEKVARSKLRAAALLEFLIDEKSQFLDLPEGPFMELVIRDGAKLSQFQTIANELKSEAGGRIDSIVRAVWEVRSVEDPLQAYSQGTGAPRAAVRFPVELKSGSGKQRIFVEVTLLASETFKEHGLDWRGIKDVVAEFVRAQLRKGGASYWDPVRFPNLEINGDTADFIVSGALPGLAKRTI